MKYTIADGIKSELAEKMALMSSAGYSTDCQGTYFAVCIDGDGVLDQVFHAEETRQWNPWHDSAVAVPVEDCFDHDNDYSWDGADGADAAVDFCFSGLLEEVEIEA